MDGPRKLMAVLAHPDDESLALGGTLARYAAEGVEVSLVCATRGGAGRYRDCRGCLGPSALGRIRSRELLEAAGVLGIDDVAFLGYRDGKLDAADPGEARDRIVSHLRRVRPQVVVTFGPDGLYGHPDHVAIGQLATAAVMTADDPLYQDGEGRAPHRVQKLYYLAWSKPTWDAYQAALKRLVMTVDGVEREATPWPDWAITTVVDTSDWAHVAQRAVGRHRSQMAIYERFNALPPEEQAALWGRGEFYRAMSTVSGGRQRETDLFEGVGGARTRDRVA